MAPPMPADASESPPMPADTGYTLAKEEKTEPNPEDFEKTNVHPTIDLPVEKNNSIDSDDDAIFPRFQKLALLPTMLDALDPKEAILVTAATS